jgi:hypothetical protein
MPRRRMRHTGFLGDFAWGDSGETMFRGPITLPIAALALLVTLTGCTPEAAGPAPESAAEATTRELETVAAPDWSIDASVVGQPAAADGVVLAYTKASSGSLQIQAWDSTTGDQLWADTAVTGAVTPGVLVTARIVEDGDKNFAVYLRPGNEEGWQDLVLADLATGTEVALTDNRVWATSRPSPCADGTDVCFTGYKESAYGAGSVSYRFATSGGDITQDGDIVLPASARLLGNRVYATNVRTPVGTEVLGASAGGKTLWERAYMDVFGDGASSDGGWAWDDADDAELMVGVGYVIDQAARAGDSFTSDATQRRVVALDPRTGETVWSIAGADFCDRSVSDEERVDGKRTLCVYNAGSTTSTKKADGTGYDSVSTDFDVDLIGVDEATGDIDWTVPLGGDRFNGDNTDSTFASFTADQVMLIAGESVVVNLNTGDHTQSSKDSQYACSTARDPLMAAYPGTSEATTFTAGSDYQGCDSGGTITDTFSIGSVRMVGVDAGNGMTVVAAPGKLLGFPLED